MQLKAPYALTKQQQINSIPFLVSGGQRGPSLSLSHTHSLSLALKETAIPPPSVFPPPLTPPPRKSKVEISERACLCTRLCAFLRSQSGQLSKLFVRSVMPPGVNPCLPKLRGLSVCLPAGDNHLNTGSKKNKWQISSLLACPISVKAFPFSVLAQSHPPILQPEVMVSHPKSKP